MDTTNMNRQSVASLFILGVLLISLLFIIGLGYGGFRFFAVTVMPHPQSYSLLALAVIAGVASFFSPCAFPLLPGYLSIYAGAGYSGNSVAVKKGDPARVLRILSLGLAAAAGVVTFNLLLGTVIGVFGAGVGKTLSISGPEPSAFVRVFRAAVGVILISLGIAQWRGMNLKPRLADYLSWRTRPARQSSGGKLGLYLYGLGYSAAGMGCTGPILAGLTLFALASGGFGSALLAFAVFSATMAGLTVIVAALLATSRSTLVSRLKAGTPAIKKISAVLLAAIGLFNLLSSLRVDLFVRALFP